MKPRPRNTSSPEVRARWQKAGALAQRMGSDATSESEDGSDNDEEKAKIKKRKREQKKERERFAKNIGLEYYLEAVSLQVHVVKPRY